MFIVEVDKVITNVTQTESMTSGSRNIFVVQFKFSDEWKYVQRTVVFRKNEDEPVGILLDNENRCMIPWEVMTDPEANVDIGVYGVKGETVVMPTTWASIGTLLQGVSTGVEHEEPTPDLYQQILARLEGVTYDFGHGFEKVGSEIAVKTTDNFLGDNTLPMSAAGVESSLGNVEILLNSI